MEEFKIIYKILKFLNKNMGNENINISEIGPDKLKTSYEKWEQLLILLQEDGYIKGLVIDKTSEDVYSHIIEPIRPKITIKDLEYLESNSMMKKAANILKVMGEIITK